MFLIVSHISECVSGSGLLHYNAQFHNKEPSSGFRVGRTRSLSANSSSCLSFSTTSLYTFQFRVLKTLYAFSRKTVTTSKECSTLADVNRMLMSVGNCLHTLLFDQMLSEHAAVLSDLFYIVLRSLLTHCLMYLCDSVIGIHILINLGLNEV